MESNLFLMLASAEGSASEIFRFAPSLPQSEIAGPSHSSGHGRPLISETLPSAEVRNKLDSIQLKIYAAEIMEDVPKGVKPGEIVSDGKTYLAIGTADGALRVTDLQLQGKKRMDVGAFLRGFRNPGEWRCQL